MTDWNKRINRYGPALIFLLAMAVRLAYLIESSHSPLFDVFFSDADYYDQKARQILSGDWLAGREVFTMSPLYPYFLALLYRLTHLDFFWVKAIQHLIGAVTAGLICRIGMILSGPATGLVAGGLAATYGLFLFAESTLENEFLVIFFNLLAVRLLLAVSPDRTVWYAAAAGFCIGISTIIRPNGLLLLIPAGLWIARRIPNRSTLAAVSALTAAAFLPVTGVALRNWSVSGEWVWTTSTGGQLVYIGTLDGGGGYLVPDFVRPTSGREHEDFEREMSRALGRPVRRGEVSGYWIREAAKQIRRDPLGYVVLVWKKFLACMSAQEPPDNYDYAFNRRYSRVLDLPWPSFGLVFPLALLGILATARPWDRWLLPLGLVAVCLFTVLITYQSYRFRLPAVPGLMLLAGDAAVACFQWIRRHTLRRLGVGISVMAAGYAVTFNPYPPASSDMDLTIAINNYYRLIERKGRHEEARTFLRESMDMDPNYGKNLGRLADKFMARGQFGLAAQYYGQLLEDTRYAGAAYQNLALCYLKLGRPQQAVVALEEYLKHNDRNADAYFLLGEAKRRLGLVTDARHAFQAALRLKPDHTAASQALRDLSLTTPP